MKITDNYTIGGTPSHHYTNTYEKTEYFCPYCGKQSVWVEDGDGDYYQGPTHQCDNVTCAREFSLIGSGADTYLSAARARQLSAGIADTPISKRGG